ncbi:MAG: hypothetical protein QW166_05575, partial [Candidatus Bathyarchaeia archaeon]
SPKILSENAPDVGDIDLWMLTNMPADILIPLVGLQIIAEQDDRPEIKKFNEYILRGLKGIGGFAARQGENIALGLGGGLGRKVVRKPGWLTRNITNRNWRKKAEEEGADDNLSLYAGFFILSLIFLAIGYHLNASSSALRMPANPDLRNVLGGVNFYNVSSGNNYTVPLTIKNPWNDTSIRIYSFLMTQPKNLANFIEFKVSVDNGTLLNPLETVNMTVTLAVKENNVTENEVYVRIGAYRAGVDY